METRDIMERPNELLSIVVPVYNVEQYLDRCVESLVNQTYQNLEIILVDDGSPDRCPEKCDQWAEKDSRIKVIHKENGGQSDARNAGTDWASGEYICYVDSDDFVEVNMLEELYKAAKKYSADVVLCGHLETTGETQIPKEDAKSITGTAGYALLRCCTDYPWAPWGKLFHKKLLVEERFTKNLLYEDYEFMPRLFSHVEKAVILSQVYYHYFIRANGITETTRTRLHLDYINVTQINLRYIKNCKNFEPYIDKLIGRHFVRFYHNMREQQADHIAKRNEFGRVAHNFIKKNYCTLIFSDMHIKYKIALSVFMISPTLFRKFFSNDKEKAF